MTVDRRVSLAAAAFAAVTLVLVVADVGGPVRAAATAVFVLVVPGLLVSSVMGPMSGAARALVSVVGSVSIATLLSLLLLAAGLWSGALAQTVLSIAVIAAVVSGRRRTTSDDPEPSDSADRREVAP